ENPPENMGADVVEAMKRLAAGGGQEKQQSKEPEKKARDIYDISFRPHAGFFVSGNDPILLFRALEKIGKVEIFADTSALPSVESFVPDQCYFNWSVFLTTAAEESDIRDIFEFASA